MKLSAFDLDRPIGSGGLGVVWSATHRRSGLPVAVKFVHGLDSSQETVSQMLAELRAVAALDHPHIVRVYDQGRVAADALDLHAAGLDAGTPWFAMERASHSLRGTPLAWEDLQRALAEVLRGLGHAHARGVIHRDLKPDNVLRCGDRWTLADFGIARLARESEEEAVTSGTPQYMAPEQITSQVRLQGPWTDLYALGCMAWELLAGKPPFDGDPRTVLFSQLNHPAPRLPGAKPDVQDWLDRLLAKRPAHRFQRAADALAELPSAATVPSLVPHASLDSAPTVWTSLEVGSPTIDPGLLSAAELPPLVAESPTTRERSRPGTGFPADWRGLTPSLDRPWFGDVGLGLVGLRQPTLVGREALCDALWDALGQVHRNRQPAMLLLEGPAGIGKTRLARWLIERAHQFGVAETWFADEGGLEGMVEQQLRTRDLHGEALVRQLDRLLPSMGMQLEAELVRWLDPSEPAVARSVVHGTVSALFRHFGGRRRIQLVHVEVPSRDVARWMVRMLEPSLDAQPVLFVVCAPHGADSDAERGLVDVLALPHTRRIEVRPLDLEGSRELIRNLVGFDEDLAGRLEALVGGNPGFAIEVVLDWVERGVLVPAERGYRLAAGGVLEVPASVAEAGQRALERVTGDGADRDAVALASLMGDEVEGEAWHEACRQAGIEPSPDLLERLLERGLVVPAREGTAFRFASTAVRQSIVQGARKRGSLARLASAVADVLRGTDLAAEILVEAERYAEAVEGLLGSIERAHRSGQWGRAARRLQLFEQALKADFAPDAPEWADLWNAQAHLHHDRGAVEPALACVDRALAHTEGVDDRRRLKALKIRANLAMTNVHPDKHLWAERQLALARKLGDRAEELAAWTDIGRIAAMVGNFDEARAILVDVVEACRDVRPVSRTHFVAPVALSGVCRLQGDLAAAEQAISVAEAALSDAAGPDVVSSLSVERGVLFQMAGDLEQAEACYVRGLQAGRRAAGGSHASHALCGLAGLDMRRGAYERAEARYRTAIRLSKSAGIAPRFSLCEILVLRGRLSEAEAELGPIVELAEKLGRKTFLGSACLLLASAVRDRPALALDHLGTAARLLQETGLASESLRDSARLLAEQAEDSALVEAARSLAEDQDRRLRL